LKSLEDLPDSPEVHAARERAFKYLVQAEQREAIQGSCTENPAARGSEKSC
jgi:hypothetical protein